MKSCCPCPFFKKCFANEYTFGAHILRVAFGIFFVLVAVKKFRMGYTGFAEALVAGEGHIAAEMPSIILYIYGLILPAAELIAGVFLLINKFVREGFYLIALMYLTFIFGQMYDGNTGKVGTDYLPSMVALVLAVFFHERASKA